MLRSPWRRRCVLVVAHAFFNNPFLTVMLHSHWWERFAMMVTHAVLQTTALGTYAAFSLVKNLCTAGDQQLEALERGALELIARHQMLSKSSLELWSLFFD